MQRNLLFLQQQAMARQAQAQQQRAAAAVAAGGSGGNMGSPGLMGGYMDVGGNVNGIPDPMNSPWLQQQQQQLQPQQQQRMQPNLPMNISQQQQQQQLDNENKIKQERLQQQRLAFMQQREALQQQQRQQLLRQTQQQQQPIAQPMVQPALQPTVPPANTIVVQNELQQNNLDLYVGRDQQYQMTLDMQHKRHMALAQAKKHEIDIANNERRVRSQNRGILTFGKGYDGYGNGRTTASNHGRVMYPGDKKRKRHHNTIRLPNEVMEEQANKEEMLVPIRLDLENDGYKIRDTFTWNMNESSITPDQFAEITCEDLRLPASVFAPLISNSIRDQIQEYFLNASSMINDSQDESTCQTNTYEEFVQCKKQKVDIEEKPLQTEENISNNSNKVELRTVIKLDIIVGNRILNDQFEWDITCKNNSPESFAQAMATDLGLGGEFKTAIAHSIREQVHVYIKSLLLTGYEFGDGPVENDDLRRSFLPAVRKVVRDNSHIERFTPSLIEVSDAEIAKIEKQRTRESRRKRRGVRNRKGATLPDREPVPTYRTIFASPPEHEMTDDQFLKSMQASQDPSYHNQRKSAMKARQNIAAEAAGVSLTSGQLVTDDSVQTNYQTVVDQVTRPVPSKIMDSTWRCMDCACSPFMTTIIRAGPSGDKTLCNACGLYRYKYNSLRPQNYMDKEIKNNIPHLNDWQNYMTKYRA